MKSKSVAKINAIITFPTSVKIHFVCFTVTGSFLITIHLFRKFVRFSQGNSNCQTVCLSVCLSLSLSPHPIRSVSQSVCLSVCLSLTLSLTLSLSFSPLRWPSDKTSASRAEDPGFESGLRWDFFGVESCQLANWHSSGYPARRLVL